ncbi:MAG: hypothetical protein J6T17_03465, partial [Clostridia bacterium]|nr:hypothetical protein [Clostridia bacterium]
CKHMRQPLLHVYRNRLLWNRTYKALERRAQNVYVVPADQIPDLAVASVDHLTSLEKPADEKSAGFFFFSPEQGSPGAGQYGIMS